MSAWHASFTLAFKHRFLIRTLVRREIAAKYRGSMLGSFWPFLAPLGLLAVYTFVFGAVFKARWAADPSAGLGGFAMVLFAGLLLHGLLAEMLSRAPELVLQQPNYVKKMIFPLETLAWVSLSTALFHCLIGFLLLTAINGLAGTGLHLSLLAIPFLILPLALLLLGVSWMLAAVGVYLRDLVQIMPPLLTCLMFLSPIFYPRAQLPEPWRGWMAFNPLTFVVENVRLAIFQGLWPPWREWLNYSLVAVLLYVLGYAVFNKLKKGFADVV